jgi:hypothetical protein
MRKLIGSLFFVGLCLIMGSGSIGCGGKATTKATPPATKTDPTTKAEPPTSKKVEDPPTSKKVEDPPTSKKVEDPPTKKETETKKN